MIDELAGFSLEEEDPEKKIKNRITYLENYPVNKAIKSISINLKSDPLLNK